MRNIESEENVFYVTCCKVSEKVAFFGGLLEINLFIHVKMVRQLKMTFKTCFKGGSASLMSSVLMAKLDLACSQ